MSSLYRWLLKKISNDIMISVVFNRIVDLLRVRGERRFPLICVHLNLKLERAVS